MSSKKIFTNRPRLRKGISKAGKKIAGKVVKVIQPIAYENAKINCPHCSNNPTIIGLEGEVRCPNCNARYFEWNPTSILCIQYKNVAEKDQHRFSVLMFQTAESIEKGDFDTAEEKCQEAFKISENTAPAWIFWAYCKYFNRPKEDILKEKSSRILACLDKADALENQEFTISIRQAISYHLFHFLQKKTDLLKNQNELKEKIFQSVSFYTYCIKICYFIHSDIFFLKEVVDHFYGQKQCTWFDYEIKDLYLEKYDFISRIVGTPGFSAPDLDTIIKEIQQKEEAYQPPMMLGGDFYGKTKKPFDELLILRKQEKEKEEETFRIGQIEQEEERIEQDRRKKEAAKIEERNRIVMVSLFVCFLIFVIWMIWSYFWTVAFVGLLFLSIFKTNLDKK